MSSVNGQLETRSQSVHLSVLGVTIIPHRWSSETKGVMRGGGVEVSLAQSMGNTVQRKPVLPRTGRAVLTLERLGVGESLQVRFVEDGSQRGGAAVGVIIPGETWGGGARVLAERSRAGSEVNGIIEIVDQATYNFRLNLADQNLAGTIRLPIR